MGSGASKSLRQGHHSDSRISSIRLNRAGADFASTADSARSNGNSTVTLQFNLHDYAAVAGKPRARSLSGDEIAPSSADMVTAQVLQALEEGREDHNSSSASLAADNNHKMPLRQIDGGPIMDDSGAYEGEAFEEDTIEWKRGETLGSGSYGTVYLARDERSGALMAVKEIVVAEDSEDDVRDASREVELLRSLCHTNIVKYLGSQMDFDARKLHIFTEWVPGGNLEQNRKRFGGSERVVRRFTKQILQGVAYLHSKRIIHHDIKPSNLLVDQFGAVKLADFGSSRLISTTTLINNESMRGTPNYMAPEVIKQSGPRSFKSDIWSVGCSVLRLLTGHPLWGDKHFDSQIALLYFIANMEQIPDLPESLSSDARSFIRLCLEIDPAKRPSAEELLGHPFVGGSGSFPYAQPSFQLPSRSVLVAVPSKRADDQHAALRIRTAPTPQNSGDPSLGVAIPSRRALASAPSSQLPPTESPKSQPTSSRYSSHRICQSPETSGIHGDEYRDDFDRPEIPVSLTVPSKLKDSGEGHVGPSSTILTPSFSDIDDLEGVYTYSEFADTMTTTPRMARTFSPANVANSWEDQPILTDAARIERERQLVQQAEQRRRKEERERKFQEELVEFRRLQQAR